MISPTELVKLQQKMLTDWTTMFGQLEMPEYFKSIFNDPTQFLKSATSKDQQNFNKELFENYLKYHTAYVKYHQAIVEMAEAVNNNINLWNKLNESTSKN